VKARRSDWWLSYL